MASGTESLERVVATSLPSLRRLVTCRTSAVVICSSGVDVDPVVGAGMGWPILQHRRDDVADRAGDELLERVCVGHAVVRLQRERALLGQVNERGVEGRPAAGPQATATKPFRILITVGESGFSMQCKAGCAWESLSYRCGTAGKCSAIVDTNGVRGPESPAGAPGQDGPVE